MEGRLSRRPRNPRGEGARLRSEIVAAAHRLLDEGGEDAVTLRAVARDIGISAPSIYRHFDDRQAILLTVAVDVFDELATSLRAAADVQKDPEARLRAVCAAYLGFAQKRPCQYRIMFGGVWDAGHAVKTGSLDAGQVTTLGASALEIIAAALQDCADPRLTSVDDPLAAATVLWVGLHGLAHQRLVAPGFPWPPDIDDRLVAALTGLSA